MLSPSNAAIGALPSYAASIKNKNGARLLHHLIFFILCFTGGDGGDVLSQAPPGDVSPALSRPWPGKVNWFAASQFRSCVLNCWSTQVETVLESCYDRLLMKIQNTHKAVQMFSYRLSYLTITKMRFLCILFS